MEEDTQGVGQRVKPAYDIHSSTQRGLVGYQGDWIDALTAENRDLLCIIDFCHEVAHGKGSLAIMDAHDIAHVLLGGDRTRKWEWAKDWTSQPKPRDVTQAWPDVRVRMKELIERLEKK